ncbi:DUF6887 family protein [Spirulina sp. 06S082]|uniref:DUF6887 family protein n=1 Tax=Spirulina sp. 06S082 TaxID=3110248 RepID=UPI002B208BEA|nr:hypothetical protein [Spirulina sp. 06S082]MEA5472555.1 hypothetical protein [Spirulina sp. 06S082]
MSKVNYATMTDAELKRYILAHRDDRNAFYAYMDRRYSRPNREAISPNDPNWKAKALSSIRAKLS